MVGLVASIGSGLSIGKEVSTIYNDSYVSLKQRTSSTDFS